MSAKPVAQHEEALAQNNNVGNVFDRNPMPSEECFQRDAIQKKKQSSVVEDASPPNDQSQHKCNDCESQFATRELLEQHKVFHSKSRPHECPKCKLRYPTPKLLREHEENHEELTCLVCKSTFKSIESLELHMKDNHSKAKRHPCQLCGHIFCAKSSLSNHVKVHHTRKGKHKCTDCKMEFRFKDYLKTHAFLHTGKKPHSCRICGKTFAVAANMRTHLKTHNSEDSYKCGLCPRTFKSDRYLMSHMNVHTGKGFVCDLCGKRYSSLKSLREHEKKAHCDERPFVCKVCKRGFVKSSALKVHMISHTNRRDFKCNTCGKQFKDKHGRERHIITAHTDEFAFSCKVCHKSFKVKEYLTEHAKIHVRVPLQCAHCHKKIMSKKGLKLHIETYHINKAEKRFSCSTCDKKFVSIGGTRDHEQIHRERKYICKVCGKGFIRPAHLRGHMIYHTDSVPVVCKLCGKRYKCISTLSRHMKRAHNPSNRYHCTSCPQMCKTHGGLSIHMARCHLMIKKEKGPPEKHCIRFSNQPTPSSMPATLDCVVRLEILPELNPNKSVNYLDICNTPYINITPENNCVQVKQEPIYQ